MHINTCNELSDYFALQFTLLSSETLKSVKLKTNMLETRLPQLQDFFSPLKVLLNLMIVVVIYF